MLTNPDSSAGTQVNNGDSHLAITARVTDQLIGFGETTQVIKVVEVATSNIDRSLSSCVKNIDEAGMTTLDQLFCPFMINLDWSSDAILPSWSEPTSNDITATQLNPFNPDLIMTDPAILYSRGPNLGFYGNDIDTGPSATGDFYQYGNLRRNGTGSFSEIRSVGFKAPIVLTGWGYDTNDKPVPADIDDPDMFANDAFRNPSLWKSGPLDVRWDDDRKVWTGGGSGGTHEIWFTIESVVCNDDNSKTLYVTATWYTGGCTKSIPGEDEYGQIEVNDPCSILDFYTADWLASGNVTGRATYMYPRGAEYCEPQWLVDQICGQPECA